MFQIENSVNFLFTILNRVFRDSSNVILSPFSLELMSFCVLSGVDGPSYDEMCTAVFGKMVPRDELLKAIGSFHNAIGQIKALQNVRFRLHNFLYLSKNYIPIQSYVDFVYSNLSTRMRPLDFENENLDLCSVIDQDIRDSTCGNVKQMLRFVPTVSKFLFVNYISFSGELKFKPTKLYEDQFQLSAEQMIDARYTVQRGLFKCDTTHPDYTYVEMPYENPNLNLCLLLPNQTTSVRSVLSGLDSPTLIQLFNSTMTKDIEVHLPIVKLQANVDLALVLQISGISKVFEEDNANFCKMVSNPKGLALESVITNSELEIQDLINISSKLSKSKRPTLVANSVCFNRPFIYFLSCDVKNEPRSILLAGVVNILEI